MTTAVTRPNTVTTRIDTPDHTATPAGMFTTTVYLNTHPDYYNGYQPHHPLAAALMLTQPLRLVFRASDRIRTHEDAADAAFTVGNHQRRDDVGQGWPADIRRLVSVGDVVKVTGPDHSIIHLSVDHCGFTAVAEPDTLVDMPPTLTNRRF